MSDVVLKLNNLTKLFENGSGITSLNLTIMSGQIFGFLGPNGAGKTTTIRCIIDEIRSYSGSIKILGVDTKSNNLIKRNIGYLSSESVLYENWNGHEHIDFLKKYRGNHSSKNFVERLGVDMKTPYKKLSSGNKQKLAFLVALYGNPKLLIMDEPTKALDPLMQQEFYKIVNEYIKNGGTVFMSSHNLPEIERLCTDFAVIKDGKISVNESIEKLNSLSLKKVTFTTENSINKEKLKLLGAKNLSVQGKFVSFQILGAINHILRELSNYKIYNLDISNVDLEELFMEFYK